LEQQGKDIPGFPEGFGMRFWNRQRKPIAPISDHFGRREEVMRRLIPVLILKGGGGQNIKLFFSSYVDEEEEGHERFD
jgi:hypothetical protein